jgi:sucrose-6-phosphate hydrolase SacC (GH32 family)
MPYTFTQNNSCYSLSNWNEDDSFEFQLPESSCRWKCPNVIETRCGGNDAVSVYKVVEGKHIANYNEKVSHYI